MSASPYEPLRLVPPAAAHKERMSWLLHIRSSARRAVDAALAATRGAAAYVSRLVAGLRLRAPLSWAHRAGKDLLRTVSALGAAVDWSGIWAAVTAVVTSPTGQAVLTAAGRALRTAGSWLARKAYSLLDRGLRCFGTPGNRAADQLFAATVSVGGRIAEVAAPVVHRVARFTDAQAPHIRLLSSLLRSYAVHRALKALVVNPLLRLLVEVVLVPAILDSRIATCVRAGVHEARVRAERLRDQADTMSSLEQLASAAAATSADGERAVRDDGCSAPPEDVPLPSNRAERRAAERQQRRHQQ